MAELGGQMLQFAAASASLPREAHKSKTDDTENGGTEVDGTEGGHYNRSAHRASRHAINKVPNYENSAASESELTRHKLAVQEPAEYKLSHREMIGLQKCSLVGDKHVRKRIMILNLFAKIATPFGKMNDFRKLKRLSHKNINETTKHLRIYDSKNKIQVRKVHATLTERTGNSPSNSNKSGVYVNIHHDRATQLSHFENCKDPEKINEVLQVIHLFCIRSKYKLQNSSCPPKCQLLKSSCSFLNDIKKKIYNTVIFSKCCTKYARSQFSKHSHGCDLVLICKEIPWLRITKNSQLRGDPLDTARVISDPVINSDPVDNARVRSDPVIKSDPADHARVRNDPLINRNEDPSMAPTHKSLQAIVTIGSDTMLISCLTTHYHCNNKSNLFIKCRLNDESYGCRQLTVHVKKITDWLFECKQINDYFINTYTPSIFKNKYIFKMARIGKISNINRKSTSSLSENASLVSISETRRLSRNGIAMPVAIPGETRTRRSTINVDGNANILARCSPNQKFLLHITR